MPTNVETTYGSDDYMESYFGIDTANAIRSRLDRYDASEGMRDLGFGLTLNHSLSSSWTVAGIFTYSRLLSDAKGQPGGGRSRRREPVLRRRYGHLSFLTNTQPFIRPKVTAVQNGGVTGLAHYGSRDKHVAVDCQSSVFIVASIYSRRMSSSSSRSRSRLANSS